MQTILTESKNEEDQKVIQKSLEKLKEATHHLENFNCQVVPVITTLVTEIPDATLENQEVTEIVTNPTQIEDSTEPGSTRWRMKIEKNSLKSWMSVSVSVENTTSNQPKVIALFTVIGICRIALLGLLVFTVVKMISYLF